VKSFVTVLRVLMACVCAAYVYSVAAQQTYPTKPIRFITPFPPGGSTDPVLRLIAQKLSDSWGQPVIADNRPGGNTVIGTEAVAKSSPDGYTILMTPSGTLIGTPLLVTTSYDIVRDFAPVATIARGELALVLNPSVPASNLQEFIALAKSKSGQLNYGSSGTGGTIHMATEFFSLLTGVKMQHIPYKGSGPLISDLIGGQLDLAFQFPISVISHIKSGRLKAIAVSGDARLADLPQLPTFTEAGLPGLDIRNWYGILAPAGTPRPIIDKLSAEVAKILALHDVKEKLAGQGLEPFVSTPEQFAALMKASIASYTKIIKATNIKLEN